MNKLFTIILLAILTSCSHEEINIIGKYKTANYSKAERYIKVLNYRGVVMGCSLDLKSDSTFIYQTCGIISNGNWRIDNDSIILKETNIRWRSDSLNQYGFKGEHPKPQKQLSFYMDGNKLINVIVDYNLDQKKEKFYLRLEKQPF